MKVYFTSWQRQDPLPMMIDFITFKKWEFQEGGDVYEQRSTKSLVGLFQFFKYATCQDLNPPHFQLLDKTIRFLSKLVLSTQPM